MKRVERKIALRCAVYTRVSTNSGLEQDFNSLDNQREASEAYIKSQAHEGWKLVRERYDDGGFSGGSMERPALQKLLDDVRARKIDVIVVYKVDRLTRSLADFAKLVELFDAHGVSFISVTQAFNTTTSMGRLTLNMLLSFAQFEREITGERIRDKVAASKRKGIWMGGAVPLGYRVEDRALHVVEQEAEFVRSLFRRYLEVGSVVRLKTALDAENIRSPVRMSGTGKRTGGVPISRGHLYWILSNPIYVGRLRHKGQIHDGLHANQAIPQHEQTRRLRRDPPTEDDVRNAIERATVSAKRIEIVLSESIVAEGQDRVLTLPWTRTSSRRRREIIQRVGEAQQPLRAMRTYRPKNHLGTNRAICSIIDPKADLLAPGRERAPTSWVEPITTPAMPTSPVMTGFPCVIAQRDQPAQPLARHRGADARNQPVHRQEPATRLKLTFGSTRREGRSLG